MSHGRVSVVFMLFLSVALGARGGAQTRTTALPAPKPVETTVSVELQPPRGAQPRRDRYGAAAFLMSSCVDDEDVECLPKIKLRLHPETGDLPDDVPVRMWLMRLDGGESQPVSVLPDHAPGTAHWQLGREYHRFRVVQWAQAHPPSSRAPEQTYQFRVSFEGGRGESVPFRLIQLSP